TWALEVENPDGQKGVLSPGLAVICTIEVSYGEGGSILPEGTQLVDAGDSVLRSRDFAIDERWAAQNCEFVVFVQNNSSKEILQAARTAVLPRARLAYAGYQPVRPAPGGTYDLTVILRNLGSASSGRANAVLLTTDPYVTITTSATSFGEIDVGEDGTAQSPLVIQVAAECPDPHVATMRLVVTTTEGQTDTLGFPLNITASPGFCDYLEGGGSGWTTSGIRNNWHLTEHRSSSATHSWYCGHEGSYRYDNECDARLMTPYFTVGDSTTLHFNQYYVVQNGDVCYLEVSNGSPFWTHIAMFTGDNMDWEPMEFDFSPYQGQTTQVRFRFVSDYENTNEGWYIDDFRCGNYLSIEGRSKPRSGSVSLHGPGSPISTSARFSYELPTGVAARLAAYDISGKEVSVLSPTVTGCGSIAWSLIDERGELVRSGTYFVRLATQLGVRTSRVVVVR
ncbi:MAG: choice-of-anchor J domain-containing protein, partial [candidate division WOR-3 bacterium]